MELASEHKRGTSETGSGVSSGMWFGPRLGKRSKRQSAAAAAAGLNTIIDAEFRSREQKNEEIANMLELLQDQPWAVVALTGNKNFNVLV